MRIAITGATGFVGRHFAASLVEKGHDVVLIARGVDERDTSVRRLPNACWVPASVNDEDKLTEAFKGCEAVAHCAGINREIGEQTYERVHVEGTQHVVMAAKRAGVRRIALVSFLRARPNCGSPYHESKWRAEEIVRSPGLEYTVLKPGMMYGKGDHMLDHLSHALHTFPFFALVGEDRPVRPIAIEDMMPILHAAVVEGRLANQTVFALGPETIPTGEVVRRVARVINKEPFFFRLPPAVHYGIAWCFEQLMTIPLVARSQVRMLTEGMEGALPFADPLPEDLRPRTFLTAEQIRRGLPEARAFSLEDLRCWGRETRMATR